MGNAGDFERFLVDDLNWPMGLANSIAAVAQSRRYPAGRTIQRQDEPGSTVQILFQGRARMRHLASNGHVLPLHDLIPGDVFGGLDPGSTAAIAEIAAVETTALALMSRDDFLRHAQTHGAVAMLLVGSLRRRLAHITNQFIARATLSSVGRVHAELLHRAGPGLRIAPPPVNAELANSIDVARETVSREIMALERRGIISRDATALTIVAPQRLQGW